MILKTYIHKQIARRFPAPSPLERAGVRLLLLCLLLTACTKADIHYPVQPDTDGLVQIYPDQSKFTLSAQVYHFYNADGTTAHITHSCDGRGNFEGRLPIGTYYVLATNSTAAGTDFRGMENHETAVVYDTTLEGYIPATRSGGNEALGCDSVYSITTRTIEVLGGDTIRREPTPESLTKSVSLIFTITGNLRDGVSDISGRLYGIYPSVHLYYCTLPEADTDKSIQTYISFSTTATEEGKPYIRRTVRFNIFGLCHPENGEVYRNLMPLTVTLDGVEYDFEIDLTENLSRILDYYQGVIPLEIPLDIELTMDDIYVKGEVKSWVPRTGGTFPIPY